MVDKFKYAGRTTGHTINNVFNVIVLSAKSAAGIRLVLLPYVHSNVGHLPVWQFVGALLLASVAYRLFSLHSKEN